MTGRPSSTKSLSISRVKKYSFILFRHAFWKRTSFQCDPVLVVLVFFIPKVSKGWREKNISTGSQFGHFPLKLCKPTFSNLLPPAEAFSKSATRWRSSMPDPCKTVLLSTWTQVLKRCNNKIYIFMQSWYVQNSIDAVINICQSSISDMTACFFSFMTWVKKV